MTKILVADDERWIRKGIVRMIDCERNPVDQILEAENLKQAIELFQQENPEIVLSDVCFPAENGCDLCDQIYRMNPDTKIVMISAYDDFNYAKRAIGFRAVEYLLKPVSKELLNDVIAQCLDRLKQEKAKEYVVSEPEEDTTLQMIEKMMHNIRMDYTKHYTLSDMAEQCHVSEAYFSNLFKRIAGKSPMNYIMQMRIEKAGELIGTTEYKMVKIARMVGYEDYQHFAKTFKKVTGETPGEFRAKIMKEIEDETIPPQT